MLRSLPSRKPSSLDEIDLVGDKGDHRHDDINNNNTTAITSQRRPSSMIPPPTFKAKLKGMRPPTRSHGSTREKETDDPEVHPLNDLYQIIHQPPSPPAPTSSSTASNGVIKLDSFVLHTMVDETGKWVKFRLYGMVEQKTRPRQHGGDGLRVKKEDVRSGVSNSLARTVEREEPSAKRKRVGVVNTKSTTRTLVSTSASSAVEMEESGTEDEDEDEVEVQREDEDHVEVEDEDGRHRAARTGGNKIGEALDTETVDLGVGLWKGYLRLSRIQHPHTSQTIKRSISQGYIHVQAVPARLPVMRTGSRGLADEAQGHGDGDIKLIIAYPPGQAGSGSGQQGGAPPPQVIGCQFSVSPLSHEMRMDGWGEEGLKGWWEMGCKMISAYNRTYAQLAAHEEKRTRPLPTATPPSSTGQVPTLSQLAVGSSQEGPGGMTRRGSGSNSEPTYGDYLALVKEVQMLKVENRQLAQENSALKGGYAGKLSLSQQQQARTSQPGSMPARGHVASGMSKIQPGIRRQPKIETGFASSSDDD